MITGLYRVIVSLCICCIPVQTIFAQHYASKDEYTGSWETPTSWNPTWALPETNLSGYNITINGYITAHASIGFSSTTSILNIKDTLVIKGNLTLNNNNDVLIENNGILIIRGNLVINNQTVIVANGYLIVTGDIIKAGSVYQGSFTSNDNPVKVFIGGIITSPGLTSDNLDYPALNCDAPITDPYPNSACSYGNFTDLILDPVYSFFQSTCTLTSIGSNSPVCTGSPINLISTGGSSYVWSGPNGFTSNAQNPSLPEADTAMAGAYTVIVTAASGCTVQTTTNVIVNPLPEVIAGSDTTIFSGTSATLHGSVEGTGPFAYSWYPSGLLLDASIKDPITVNLTTTTVFTLTATSSATSCSGKNDVTITVSGGPLGSTTAANPSTVCAGEEVQLYALAGGGSGSYTYAWTSTPAGFTAAIAKPKVSPLVTTVYHVVVSDGFNSVSTQVEVTVNAKPDKPTILADGPTTFCSGGSVTLMSSPGAMYFWSTGEATSSIKVSTTGNYTVQVANESGCESDVSAPAIIVVNALPKVKITSNSSAMCLNDQRILEGNPAGGIFSITNGPGSITGNILSATGTGFIGLVYSYTDVCSNEATQSIFVTDRPVAIPGPDQELDFIFETRMNAEMPFSDAGEWSLVSGSGHISDIHSPSASVTGLSVGENIFSWSVWNDGCEESADIKITVHDLFIPSVITPNGDGKNDYFKISEFGNQVGLIIFNRWGNEEYSNGNYLNDWDGKNYRGVELPGDTYFYILKFDNGVVRKGSVLILR